MSIVQKCDICGGIEGVDETENGQITFTDLPYKMEVSNYNNQTFYVYVNVGIENVADSKNLTNMLNEYSDDELSQFIDGDGNLMVGFDVETPHPKICNICSKKLIGRISLNNSAKVEKTPKKCNPLKKHRDNISKTKM
jgi:hypothetical protein